MFSEKATKIDEIFTIDWHYVVSVKSTVKISSNFVVFLENMNFTKNEARLAKLVKLAKKKCEN